MKHRNISPKYKIIIRASKDNIYIINNYIINSKCVIIFTKKIL